MSTEKTPGKAAQILSAIKKILFADEQPATPISVTTTDGVELSVNKMEVGGTVMSGGAPAPANSYVLQDGTTLVVDGSGLITSITPATPAAAPTPAAEPAPVETAAQGFGTDEVLDTPEKIRKATEAFATGTPEERVAAIEICVKALMEYAFGWQMREAKEKQDRDAAMAVYNASLNTTQSAVATQQQAMKQMYDLVSELVQLPADEPPADSKSKFSFSKVGEKKKGLEKYQEAARQIKLEKQN
ncbi:MAG: hypothetical protein ACTHMC_01405 [Pseudobacter sp.]|uniref:hypothetical protein n=1 Tax=Pseudobacter sp. TaxID=2045420 RepID=UPI003F823756